MDRSNLIVDVFARSIAWREGFFYNGKTATIAQMLGNPGCLERWKDPSGNPYTEINGYAEFPQCTVPNCRHKDHPCEVGWRALRAQVKINIFKRNLNFFEFFAGRRGVYEGFAPLRKRVEPQPYAVFVMERVGRALGRDVDLQMVVSSLVADVSTAAQ